MIYLPKQNPIRFDQVKLKVYWLDTQLSSIYSCFKHLLFIVKYFAFIKYALCIKSSVVENIKYSSCTLRVIRSLRLSILAKKISVLF